MQEIKIKTPKTARIYVSGNITEKTEEIVIAIHGYAQLGKFFIKKFTPIISEKRVVVVPEALNKFYWNGMKGKVVASWMTKDDRESEIEDYTEYLNKVYELIIKDAPANVKITVLGFSQGTATSCRWISDNNHSKISRLILWASAMPKEVFSEAKLYEHIDFTIILGDKDEYISIEELNRHVLELKEEGFNPKSIVYEGNHTVNLLKNSDLFS